MTRGVRLKSVALPVEHGGWGFLFEPLLLALPVAGSLAGISLALTAGVTFLLRHPLKLFLRSAEPVATSPRRRAAMIVSVIYGSVALGGLAGTIGLGGMEPLIPLLIVSPFAAVYLFYDTRKQSRRLFPVISGPVALAGMAPAIALAGGWDSSSASALWVILMARTIPSIFYVRARLRVERAQNAGVWPVLVLHVLFGVILVILVHWGYAPLLTLIAFLMLALRALRGLSRFRRPCKPRRVGFLEIAYGLFYAGMSVAGFIFEI